MVIALLPGRCTNATPEPTLVVTATLAKLAEMKLYFCPRHRLDADCGLEVTTEPSSDR